MGQHWTGIGWTSRVSWFPCSDSYLCLLRLGELLFLGFSRLRPRLGHGHQRGRVHHVRSNWSCLAFSATARITKRAIVNTSNAVQKSFSFFFGGIFIQNFYCSCCLLHVERSQHFNWSKSMLRESEFYRGMTLWIHWKDNNLPSARHYMSLLRGTSYLKAAKRSVKASFRTTRSSNSGIMYHYNGYM